MISPHHKCIFIHVPKTGGTSVEHAFLSDLGLTSGERDQLLLGPNPDRKRGPRRLSHLTAAELLDLGFVSRESFYSYFKFGFVRDPWDRVVSTYKYFRIGGEFKRFACDILPNSLYNSQYYGYFVRPQYGYLYSADDICLVDFVGRFERLDDDFQSVRERLRLNAGLPHENRQTSFGIPLASRLRQAVFGACALNMAHVLGAFGAKEIRSNSREYFDDESAAFVGEFYKDDVRTFGYEF